MSFAVLPIEVALDPRLSKRQIKVLIALFSFMNNQSSTVWPSRDKLAERCGLRPTRISEVTTELVGLGWLSKEGKGGFSKASKYTITVPILGTAIKPEPKRTTVPKLVSVKRHTTVPKTGTVKGQTTVPKTGTGPRPQNGDPHARPQNRDPQGSIHRTIQKKGGGEIPPDPPAPKKNTRSKKFIPPTLEDVEKYIHDRGSTIDPKTFIDYYRATNWMRGKNKIKDWKACVRTWEQRDKEKTNGKNHHLDAQSRQRAATERLLAREARENSGKARIIEHADL